MSDLAHAPPGPRRGNGRLIGRLLLVVATAFAFGFALVPLYDILCKATGFNGKTAGGFSRGGLMPAAGTASVPTRVDRSRLVTVEFVGTVMPGLPWDLRPLQPTVELHPGELQTVRFLVRNHSSEKITGHAAPSVSPGQAAQHFEKVDCFCFSEQTLLPGEARELPLVFIVKPELDPEVKTITLSYSFFNTTRKDPKGTRS